MLEVFFFLGLSFLQRSNDVQQKKQGCIFFSDIVSANWEFNTDSLKIYDPMVCSEKSKDVYFFQDIVSAKWEFTGNTYSLKIYVKLV